MKGKAMKEEDGGLVNEIEQEMKLITLIAEIERKAIILSLQCDNEIDLTSSWAAIDTAVTNTFKQRAYEIGSDPDVIMQNIEKINLTDPL